MDGRRVLLQILGKLIFFEQLRETMPENGMIIGASWLYRYNMSYIVQQSALNGKPVLGVSINYRLSAFGFLDSEEVRVCVIGYPNDLEESLTL